jgi:hypothetical protein
MQQSLGSRRGQKHDHTNSSVSLHPLRCVALPKMSASHTLARGRKTQNWLAIALVASGLTNIAVPVYFWSTSHVRDQVVVFDLASGSLLLSPMVDPSSSKEILETCSSWAAKCILDRSPSGLDNEDLTTVLFNSETARKIRDEFAGVKQQYLAKNLRSHVEIRSIDSQPIGNGIIKAKITGQVIITGTLNGTSIQDVQPVSLELSLVRNPDLSRVHRYPLMCFAYQYDSNPIAKK